ncbi:MULTISPECIES: restriction endonuclease subunit S [Halolamina]|uniref:Type I restriction enzyme, S subunit n=1 Tax=Halolamina pelagica TaxID=699431 RepID=A0A1I5TD46_9EURY|nr:MULTISPECIES: restriction endonuclease subunit S [Halolamina]NHX37288.1 restriction endonuclease subunit S [Halolamina sp. R1-12]SFP80940.1 type I restriction enzyme, S subunit [Halolamina pelagica]
MSEEAKLDESAQEMSSEENPERPDDWGRRPLSEISLWTDAGGTPRTSNDEYWDGDIPWVQTGELTKRHIRSTEKHITELGLEESTAKRFPPGTLLIGMYGEPTVGESALLEIEATTNQACCGVSPNTDIINAEFLHQMMQYEKPRLYSLRAGSGQQNIRQGIIRKFEIDIPPLSEQRKIATALYTVDRATEKTEEIIGRVSRIKKGFKQDVFSKGYFDHQSHQESQVGKIPESWKIESAADLCDGITVGVVTGATDSYVSPSEGVPFIRSQDIHENHIEQDSLKYISEEFHEQQNSSELREGDVITVRTGEPGTSCVVPAELDGANCFSLIISRPKEEVNERFYSYYINSEKALDFIDSWKAGGVQDNFNVGVMERLPVPVPTPEEQQAIVDSLDDINHHLESEREYRNHLQRLKRGLMQDLLSGKVQTTDTNIEVPEEVAQHG